MDIADIPLFAMLRSRLGYLSERQRVIAQNVANDSTPGFTPQDLKPFTFKAKLQAATTGGDPSALAVTQPGHIPIKSAASTAAGQVKAVKSKDSETNMDGNSVVLEEEMMKMSQARMDYDAAVGFYQKSLDILKLATRKPGA